MRREVERGKTLSFSFFSNARPRTRRAFFPLAYNFNNFPGAFLYNLTIDRFPEMWYNKYTERGRATQTRAPTRASKTLPTKTLYRKVFVFAVYKCEPEPLGGNNGGLCAIQPHLSFLKDFLRNLQKPIDKINKV